MVSYERGTLARAVRVARNRVVRALPADRESLHPTDDVGPLGRGRLVVQGYLAQKKQPPLGPPYDPRHGPTVESQGVVSYERGTPVALWLSASRETASFGHSLPKESLYSTYDFGT